jgi:hypothetical protein
MSTQPIPTFPMVAGLEYLYGMTIDEMINAMADEVPINSMGFRSSYIEESSDFIPSDSQTEELHTLDDKSKLTLPFAILAKNIAYDKNVDLKIRVLASYLLYTHLA